MPTGADRAAYAALELEYGTGRLEHHLLLVGGEVVVVLESVGDRQRHVLLGIHLAHLLLDNQMRTRIHSVVLRFPKFSC